MASIGSLNEKSLHAALKAWCLQPGDQTEVPVDGYFIDIVRGDLLIEIQTRNFSAIKAKLLTLTAKHPVQLIYPIAQQKWIVKLPTDGHRRQRRRKSPKRGTLFQIFEELVSFPELLAHPNFTLHIVSIQEEEVRCHDRRRGWRRKGWVTHDRRLLHVMEGHFFEHPEDMEFLIPTNLSDMFTTADLAKALNTSHRFAQKMAYCLDRMNLFIRIGKRGNAIVYGRSKSL
ncbi:hypothetical protein ACFL27_22620 [candidate division CSSED10-310 bacterium]|uniref:DUF8091 domain-containing protein n=1 Tax=candidate division CSSED10-310 bacterium TaxID=2855610 RepID=A0ABV6Z3H1_UNCC1